MAQPFAAGSIHPAVAPTIYLHRALPAGPVTDCWSVVQNTHRNVPRVCLTVRTSPETKDQCPGRTLECHNQCQPTC